jgi:hypothetical protein
LTESVQPSIRNPGRLAISLENGRQYELAPGEIVEVQCAGRWQRAQIAESLWGEPCAMLRNGKAVHLTVGLPARLLAGHPAGS